MERQLINAPSGFTQEELEVALIAPLGVRPSASEFVPRLLAAYLWWKNDPSSKQNLRSGWFFESREPGAIYAGYERAPHYLRAKVVYDASSVRILVAGSENLSQSDSRIHKVALGWLDDLDGAIRSSIAATVILTQGQGTTTLFEASLQELTRNHGEGISPLLSAACEVARANGRTSEEFISLERALPDMNLTPSQLVDPVAGVYPGYVDVELGDWFARSLAELRGRSPGASADVLRDVFKYAERKGEHSSEYEELREALPTLNLTRTELGNVVESTYPAFAAQALEAISVKLAVETGEDRLLREDLATALQAVSPAIIILDQAGPNAIVVSVTRLQWNELQAAERTEIITYSYNQVDVLKAALLMPNYASYLVDRTTGEAEIEYAFEVRAVSPDGVLLDRVIRDRINRSYAFCQNARIQNVYGGVQPAGFVANAHMAGLCSGDTTPVRVSNLRQDVFNRLANDIAAIPSIRAAIARY